MALTREELLLAADVAEKYPVGSGTDWGYGVLEGREPASLEEYLKEHPDHIAYG